MAERRILIALIVTLGVGCGGAASDESAPTATRPDGVELQPLPNDAAAACAES